MPFRLGAPELIIILLIIMVIFGAAKLPQLGGALGKSIREFRKEAGGEKKSDEREVIVSEDSHGPEAAMEARKGP
ncbi:MAG: twin-arginine translocase TatA/TatE family subunit [Chloroflexi bacterium]|nr:twin-arginine translocase TatA/TatE family subunit [Chloroflexota bacterium]